jgi:hypothetical protein
MPNPTATLFVPYHALDDLHLEDADEFARTPAANVFTADQTIEGNLIVTGEINPADLAARWAAQRPKVEALERVSGREEDSVRTLLSQNLTVGMSLRHDADLNQGRITVGNYDTQAYQPLVLEANHISLVTGTDPPGLSESVRVHTGGVTLGQGADHDTDPGVGVLRARALQGTLATTDLSGMVAPAQVGPLPPARLLGRNATTTGPSETITVGAGLVLQGTTLSATAKPSGFFGYTFSSALTAPPVAQTLRFNAAYPYTAVTKVWVHYLNINSEDMYFGWMRLDPQSTLIVQDKESHAQYVEFKTSGPVIDRGTYAELPVAWKANGTALVNNNDCLARTMTPGALELETRLAALEARVAALEAR